MDEALAALKETSRTFYIPIAGLPCGLKEAVASAYLCLRAIDEIEDHDLLPVAAKTQLLRGISRLLQAGAPEREFKSLLGGEARLPSVTLALPSWLSLASPDIAPRVWDATAAMADRMAEWATRQWDVKTVSDLDRYTFGVAGAVGILLCDLWSWYDGTPSERRYAVGFGRGLQATNIILNRRADIGRGVDYYPDGWTDEEMRKYATTNLLLADIYEHALPAGPIRLFCRIPLALAWASLEAHGAGLEKLSRPQVEEVVARCQSMS